MPAPEPAMSRALAFSASSSRKVFVSISGSLQRNSIKRRGRSSTASFPSASLRPEKGKRPSKQEKVALVKSFVDKYRASNAGKFPTVSLVRQEIGGSYYVLRQIVQEMEYNHKFSPSMNETLQMDKVEGIKDQSFEQFQMPKVEEHGAQSHEPFQTAVVNDQSSNVEVEGEHKHTSKSEVDEAFWHPSGKNVSRTIEDTIVEHSRDRQSANTITSDIDENQRNRVSEAVMTTAYVNQEEVVSEAASSQEIVFLGKTEVVQFMKTEASDQNFDSKNEHAMCDGDEILKSDVKTEDKPTVNLRSGIQDTSEYSSRQTVDNMLENNNPNHPPDKHGLGSSGQTTNDMIPDIAEQKGEHHRKDQDEGSSRTSSLWRNLKSFTDGIFGFWKKL